MPTPPMVVPKPVEKLVTDAAMSMPAIAPVASAPMVSDRKGCSFTQVMRTMMIAIPSTAAVIS